MPKPNPEVLLDIIREIGRVPSECVYLGDSKMKDVAMAQDAGVTDVLAGYGAVQHQEEYNLLREVSHWPDVDVKREFGTDSVRPKLGGEIPGVMGERRLGGGVGREQTMLIGRDARLRGNVDDHARPLRLHDCRRRLEYWNHRCPELAIRGDFSSGAHRPIASSRRCSLDYSVSRSYGPAALLSFGSARHIDSINVGAIRADAAGPPAPCANRIR